MSIPSRPDPDSLLSRLQKQAARETQGRLKIFFGASAGVGKTYAMLSAARRRASAGMDVVIGHVEVHGRADTEALQQGMERMPSLVVDHRGIRLLEFDLDAALLRRPKLVLVDELAHTNHAGTRHAKRWQDIMELLDAGIDVYTTLNVQHLESLNDVVAQITGVQVRETLPDSIFERADEVELIDLPPDELLDRMREGMVYVGDKADRALENFFRKGNLIALRQLALRATADRVDVAMREYRESHAIGGAWLAGERVLVCIGADDLSERLVRAARRLAFALRADWIAAYVETPGLQEITQAKRDRVLRALRLAESLGAEVVNVSGESVAVELMALANQRNVSKIMVGKPVRRGLWRRRRRALVDELIRQSGDIDVYVVTGESEEVPARGRQEARPGRGDLRGYVFSVALVAIISVICRLAYGHIELANMMMLYLFGIVVAAARVGRGPSVLAAFLSIAVLDFLFVDPIYSLAVANTQYLITFAVMLTVGLQISRLTAQGRLQAVVARHRERRTAQLFALSRELSVGQDVGTLADVLRRHVLEGIEGEAIVLMPDAEGKLEDPSGFCTPSGHPGVSASPLSVSSNELGIAQWAFDHRQPAGRLTGTLASASALFIPLDALDRSIGVLGLRPRVERQLQVPEQRHLLDALVSQTAVAIERVQLTETARTRGLAVESERIRNTLLSSISHDFRTPLVSIIGVTSSLLETEADRFDQATWRNLLRSVLAESRRMHRMVSNLLDLSRLSTGANSIRNDSADIADLVGAVLYRLRDVIGGRPVSVRIAPDLPLARGDEVLLEQVLSNLVENALKYTPSGTPVEIDATTADRWIVVGVRDHGPGLIAGEEERVFDKFYRGSDEQAQSGTGLGLAICRAILEAHGGRISARNESDGGARFSFTVPIDLERSMPHEC